MADFREIIQKRKSKNRHMRRDLSMNTLVETNENLEEKIECLYEMLGGDSSGLVIREKLCEEKLNKVGEAIAKLERARQEINNIIKDAHNKLEKSEQREKDALVRVQQLTSENVKLKRDLAKAHEFNSRLLRTTSEDTVQYQDTTKHSESSIYGNIDSMKEKSIGMDNDGVQRLDNIEETVKILTGKLDKIQIALERLTDPITTSSMFHASNPYEQIEKFLES
ncbi:hypothetical protein [Candidatus Uabimicrobium sp. HlEnr_7]|uniref:hypothetical protein n=1 Tax=Candidatus Uabimicrobium helgolandensis TaxID=3095367 RepID=UPI0035586B7E